MIRVLGNGIKGFGLCFQRYLPLVSAGKTDIQEGIVIKCADMG